MGNGDEYDRIALPAILTVSRTAHVLTRRDQQSIFVAYNSILDEACTLPDVAGVVLLHDDTELRDSHIEEKLQHLFQTEPDVAIVGAIGGRYHRSMAWWTAEEKFGHAPDTVTENHYSDGTHDVNTVDGLLLALSPWAVRHLRFDTNHFRGFHGYDADICAQARRAGRRVVVAPIELFHHRKQDLHGDFRAFYIAALTWQLKWLSPSPARRLKWLAGLALLRTAPRALAQRALRP